LGTAHCHLVESEVVITRPGAHGSTHPLQQLADVVSDERKLPGLTPPWLSDRDGDAVRVDIETDESYVFHGWTRLPL
jgi:hypothetical protein